MASSNSSDTNSKSVLESEDYQFEKTQMLYESFEIAIEKEKDIHRSVLYVLPLNNDSIKIVWNATTLTGTNPFSKISRYLDARELGKRFEIILNTIQKYVSDTKNIYGINIKREKFQLDFMVSIKKSFTRYPTTEDIYTIMGQIREHIANVKATETDYPVLNVSPRDSTHFDLVVAVPVDRQVPDFGIFTERRMLKNGNFLSAEIKGGKNTVDAALKQLDIYAHDYQLLNVAIPFQQFLTDRTKEADTSKWVTRIGYPFL